MEEKLYTAKELNELIGYVDKTGTNSSQSQLITRCKNAGVIIEPLPTNKRGSLNHFKIIENNFLLPNETWITSYYSDNIEVSNMGRARRASTKKQIGSENKLDGYWRVCTIDPKTKRSTNLQLNRLVYFSFNPDDLPYAESIQIDHINGQRGDNRLENLRPLTAIENSKARDENQTIIKTLTTQLIQKYGYKKIEKIFKNLLTND